MSCFDTQSGTLRAEQIAEWMQSTWIADRPSLDLRKTWTTFQAFDDVVINKIDAAARFADYRFTGYRPIECEVVNQIDSRTYDDVLSARLGAFLFTFEPDPASTDATESVEVLGICFRYGNYAHEVDALAAVPLAHTAIWTAFVNECNRLAYDREGRVVVIGGHQDSFVPMVKWSEIVLPAELKDEILDDVRGFYDKGVAIYNRLNLKPFRKLLFAGVPGTGKSMICNALAKWALERDYRVIYVSSAGRRPGDDYGSTFEKVQHALEVAAYSDGPALIILEELDAYLHSQEKALILNVLDGSESTVNAHGTLLISTTNYPEAIDERVLKRPGRLDRIFIVPQTQSMADASAMLQRYLGAMWQPAHAEIVPLLVGYPGAFIREVAIYALTQVAYDDLTELPVNLLVASLDRLKAQLAARDAFLQQREADQTAAARTIDAAPGQTPSTEPAIPAANGTATH